MSQNNPLTALLENQPFVVLDGAMATELEARGCNLADSLWSAKVLMENPELIRDVHLDYYRAGAQVAIACGLCRTRAGRGAIPGVDWQKRRAGTQSAGSVPGRECAGGHAAGGGVGRAVRRVPCRWI